MFLLKPMVTRNEKRRIRYDAVSISVDWESSTNLNETFKKIRYISFHRRSDEHKVIQKYMLKNSSSIIDHTNAECLQHCILPLAIVSLTIN